MSTAPFQVGSNPEAMYVDLACTDSAQYGTFSAVAQDLIRTLRLSQGPIRDSVINALARWRAFWSVATVGLSQAEALGLFGELWFLHRWLPAIGSEAVNRWQVTDAARHDFQWSAASVEVKTAATQTTGAPCHKIVSLDQLADPKRGELYLFSLHVCDDAMSMNTLHSIVNSVTSSLKAEFQAVADLNDKLAARGYSPADRNVAERPLRILAERLYRLGPGFPRLTRQTFEPVGLPTGVVAVEYTIDLSACKDWLVAESPTDASASALVQ
ncbi:MAG: PD-(D/E)XK motif protein [Planctomycetes bacterium]|nr:PD-(D/E)XK motif protein [Planctomycetota bacterium]